MHFPITEGVLFDRTVGHVKAVDGVDLTHRARARPTGWSASPAAASRRSGRALLRLIPPTGGEVIFDGVELTTLAARAAARACAAGCR